MEKITKNNTVASVLKINEKLSDVFLGFGMYCIFCHLGETETIEEAAQVHNVELDLLLKKLNETLIAINNAN